MFRSKATCRLTGVLSTLLLGGVFLFPGAADAADKVTFRLGWLKTATTAAPYYYALEKGLFAAQGLDVSVLEGQGSATNVKLVAAGDTMIASADLGTAAIAITKGIPIRAVFGEMQSNPMAVISLGANPVKTAKEMEGKAILGSAASSYTKFLLLLCKKSGADCKKINLRLTTPPFEPVLLSGKADAMLGYFTDNVPKLAATGASVHHFLYSTYGVDIMSNGLIVNEDTIKNRADILRRFLVAVSQAWQVAKERPDEVVDAWIKVLGRGDKATYSQILKNAVSILHTKNSAAKPVGWMAPADWDNLQKTLIDAGELNTSIPIDRYFSNDFVPAAS